MAKGEDIFEAKGKSKKSQVDEEKDALLKTIGQLKIENDFLKVALH